MCFYLSSVKNHVLRQSHIPLESILRTGPLLWGEGSKEWASRNDVSAQEQYPACFSDQSIKIN